MNIWFVLSKFPSLAFVFNFGVFFLLEIATETRKGLVSGSEMKCI